MSRMPSATYEIGRAADRCAATGRALVPGERFVAALIEADSGDRFERRDFAADAWESGARPARLFAFWRGVVPAAAASGKPVIDAASLLGLFEQLGEADDPKRIAFRYVLALLLLRKRHLVPAGMRPGALLVRMKGTPPEDAPIEVIDPEMDESAVAEITEQLRSLLRIEA